MEKAFFVEMETVFIGIFGKRNSSTSLEEFDTEVEAEAFALAWKQLTAPHCSEAHTRILRKQEA